MGGKEERDSRGFSSGGNEHVDGTETRVRIGNDLFEEFSVTIGVHQGSVISLLLFSIVIDVITESARENSMLEILYADDLVL